MTTDDIEAELIKLRRIELTDKEAAQSGDDMLRCAVLQWIADGYEPVAATPARLELRPLADWLDRPSVRREPT